MSVKSVLTDELKGVVDDVVGASVTRFVSVFLLILLIVTSAPDTDTDIEVKLNRAGLLELMDPLRDDDTEVVAVGDGCTFNKLEIVSDSTAVV